MALVGFLSYPPVTSAPNPPTVSVDNLVRASGPANARRSAAQCRTARSEATRFTREA